jgi:hypothetical protein
MRVYGIDFTSRPRPRKPITCAVCWSTDGRLVLEEMRPLSDFMAFEALLAEPGPWIAGIDCPFGQSRRFIENIGWPTSWASYVGLVGGMTRPDFRAALEAYRAPRAIGDREHRRRVDAFAGSISPQKLFGVPVALMFYEGATRILESGATVPPLQCGDPERLIVEAYPGVLARQLIGRRSYKSDTKRKQETDHLAARQDILAGLTTVDADCGITIDPTGDQLDALLCAVQAAWAWSKRDANYGIPSTADPLEGWIVDESLYEAAA